MLVRVSCEFSGRAKLLCKGAWRQVAQRRMRPMLVVVDPPFVNPLSSIGHRQEPCGIKAFLPDAAVERLVIKELVRHEVHGPDVVHHARLRSCRPVAARAPPPGAAHADRQPFFAVEPVDAFVVHRPPFPPEQDMELAIHSEPGLRPNPSTASAVPMPDHAATGSGEKPVQKPIALQSRRSDVAKTS